MRSDIVWAGSPDFLFNDKLLASSVCSYLLRWPKNTKRLNMMIVFDKGRPKKRRQIRVKGWQKEATCGRDKFVVQMWSVFDILKKLTNKWSRPVTGIQVWVSLIESSWSVKRFFDIFCRQIRLSQITGRRCTTTIFLSSKKLIKPGIFSKLNILKILMIPTWSFQNLQL